MTKFIKYLIENPSYDQTISNYTINLHKLIKDDCNLFANMYTRYIFPSFVDVIQKKTKFSEVTSLIGENNRIKHFMYNGLKKTHMVLNPLYSVKGRKNNTMFSFINKTPNNPNSARHICYLGTQKSNMLSYYNTINNKEIFTYIALESKLNSLTQTSISNSSCKEYIDIVKEISDPNKPWCVTNKIKTYNITIIDDLAISGGRPGVPNSIYISMVDNSWLFMFTKGTCLIITGKQNIDAGIIDNLDETTIARKSFLITFMNNITTVINIIMNIINSPEFIKKVYEEFDVKCNHTHNENTRYKFCDQCSSSTKAIISVNKFIQLMMLDMEFISDIKQKLYVNDISNLDALLEIENRYKSENTIFEVINFGVAGLRLKNSINSIVSNTFTDKEIKHINIFSGRRVIFKSIKSVDMLKDYQSIYFDKKIKSDEIKSELNNINIFSLSVTEKDLFLKSLGF